MKNSNLLILALVTLLFVGCSKDDDTTVVDPVIPPPETSDLTITLNGLDVLDSNYVYEGWIMVNNNPVSTGRFNTTGLTTTKVFTALKSDLDAATAFVLSIELAVGDTPEPSATKILSGTFTAGAAALKIDSVVGDFITNPFSGTFINKTPTDMDNNNDEFGIWFLEDDLTTPGLKNLPMLSPGWKYEGWVIFPGPIPVTTGKFLVADEPDFLSPYSGNGMDYPVPGEDFIGNLPMGVTSGDTTGLPVVISIEPDFISDPNAPFFLKPIGGTQGVDNNALTLTSNINVTINGTAIK